MKKVLSNRAISIIGGMCYSIYLIHFMILSAASQFLAVLPYGNQWFSFFLDFMLLTLLVVMGSMIFYRLVEQPCMRKDWYKHIFRRANKKLSQKIN